MYKTQYRPKFFPFSPGIPWSIDRGKYIRPEIDLETWHKVLDGRNIIVTAFGGIFESFFSLAAAEALASFDPGHKLFWIGNDEFSFFVRAHGLCKISDIALTPDILQQYPVPIFFDREDNAYFNILNNYLVRKSYWGKYPEEVKTPVTSQMFGNVMVPWNNYIPRLRNMEFDFYNEICNTGVLRQRSKIALIILNPNKDREDTTLQWSVHNIKEFVQLSSHKGIKPIVFTDDVNAFYGSHITVYEYNMRKVLQLMIHSWVVMSDDIGWLLLTMALSNAKVIAKHMDGPFNLLKNAEFLGLQNDIFTDREWVSPIDAFTICEGLL